MFLIFGIYMDGLELQYVDLTNHSEGIFENSLWLQGAKAVLWTKFSGTFSLVLIERRSTCRQRKAAVLLGMNIIVLG